MCVAGFRLVRMSRRRVCLQHRLGPMTSHSARLQVLKLEKYHSAFAGWTLSQLASCTDAQLQSLGLPLGEEVRTTLQSLGLHQSNEPFMQSDAQGHGERFKLMLALSSMPACQRSSPRTGACSQHRLDVSTFPSASHGGPVCKQHAVRWLKDRGHMQQQRQRVLRQCQLRFGQ